MIEIDIPSIDPIQHEPKIFLGMTSRQCLLIVPGVAIGAILFYIFYGKSLDVAVVSAGIGVAPFICFGWIKKYNMKFEDWLRLWFFNNFVSNPKRIYKDDSVEYVKMLTIKERQELEKKEQQRELDEKKKKKKSVKKNSKEDK